MAWSSRHKSGKLLDLEQLNKELGSVIDSGLLQFPVELLVQIFAMLPVRDRILCLRTCRYFRDLGQDNQAIWRTLTFVKVPKSRTGRCDGVDGSLLVSI
jgi:hypothetical protein